MSITEVDFKVEKEEDDPEKLRMEHFYFPLGLWLGGFLLSAIILLAEIIIHSRRKSQTREAEVDRVVSENIEHIENTNV